MKNVRVSNNNTNFFFLLTGITKADRQELEAISNFFGRQKPIKVGSIKAILGNTECVSGVCAIIKVIIFPIYSLCSKFSNIFQMSV